MFSGTFETRLTVHEARQHGEVVFNLISSSFMRQFQGAWKVRILSMHYAGHLHVPFTSGSWHIRRLPLLHEV